MIWEVISGTAINDALEAKLRGSPSGATVPVTAVVDYAYGIATVAFRVAPGDRQPHDSDRLSESIEMAMACRFAAYAYDKPSTCDAEPGLEDLHTGTARITLTGNDALAVVLGFFEGCLNHLACAA
jgi:hypothetical protein